MIWHPIQTTIAAASGLSSAWVASDGALMLGKRLKGRPRAVMLGKRKCCDFWSTGPCYVQLALMVTLQRLQCASDMIYLTTAFCDAYEASATDMPETGNLCEATSRRTTLLAATHEHLP